MSDPMMPPEGGQGLPKSPFNPGDAALMKKAGVGSENQPFGQFLEQSFGIKWEDPTPVAIQKMKGAIQNKDGMGKVKTMAGQGAPPPGNVTPGMPEKPMPQGRPMAVQGGLSSLMGG